MLQAHMHQSPLTLLLISQRDDGGHHEPCRREQGLIGCDLSLVVSAVRQGERMWRISLRVSRAPHDHVPLNCLVRLYSLANQTVCISRLPSANASV